MEVGPGGTVGATCDLTRGDGQLSASAARCCGGACRFLDGAGSAALLAGDATLCGVSLERGTVCHMNPRASRHMIPRALRYMRPRASPWVVTCCPVGAGIREGPHHAAITFQQPPRLSSHARRVRFDPKGQRIPAQGATLGMGTRVCIRDTDGGYASGTRMVGMHPGHGWWVCIRDTDGGYASGTRMVGMEARRFEGWGGAWHDSQGVASHDSQGVALHETQGVALHETQGVALHETQGVALGCQILPRWGRNWSDPSSPNPGQPVHNLHCSDAHQAAAGTLISRQAKFAAGCCIAARLPAARCSPRRACGRSRSTRASERRG